MAKKNDAPQPATQALDGVPAIYRLPRSKGSLKQNRFRFQLESEIEELGDDAPVHEIPLIKYLPPKIALEVEHASPQQALIHILGLTPGDLLEKLEGLDELENLVQAWASASGVTLGE